MNAVTASQTRPPLIGTARWRKLPVRWRVAVGASLVEEVAALYSRHFRERFRVDATLWAAWRFACGQAIARDLLARLKRHITPLVDEYGDSDGYSFHQLFMAGYLLEEIGLEDGRGISAAVDAAAIGLSAARLYQCNLNGRDLDVEVVADSLGDPVYWAAQKRYAAVRKRPPTDISKTVFRDHPLELPGLPPAVFAAIDSQRKRRTKYPDAYLPPVHERPRSRKVPRPRKATR